MTTPIHHYILPFRLITHHSLLAEFYIISGLNHSYPITGIKERLQADKPNVPAQRQFNQINSCLL